MPHPHLPLIYSRKQVSSTKKVEWGDPSRLERIHRTLRQKYVATAPKLSMTRQFQLLDKEYPNTLSARGFNALLVNSGVNLSPEDMEHLFSFYDAEGHGSLDMNDFLIGIRYNLAMDKAETDRIRAKLQPTLVRGRSYQELERLLASGGLPAEGITETAFVRACRNFVGSTCTTSELLFLFSVMSNNDRSAAVPLSAVTRMLYGGAGPEGCDRVIDVPELLERLAKIIYHPNGAVSGRIGLNRILARGDKDFNGAINRREFECIKSFAPFDDAELDALFAHFDRSGAGLVRFDDIVQSFRPQQHLCLTEREMATIEDIALRHIRNRSPGGPGFHRTYQRYLEQTLQKYDPENTGFFNLTQFYRAIEDLAGGDLKDMEVEVLFEHWAKGGRVDWHQFLWILLGEADKQAAREQVREVKRQDAQYIQELRERMAFALHDRDRQTQGPRGFLRIERLFDRQDMCGTGQLTEDEFRRALRALPGGVPFDDDDIGLLFRSFARDGARTISLAEFTGAMQQIVAERALERKRCEEVPYPHEDLAVLKEAVVKGAMRRRLGKHGLLMTFGKHDSDGDGLIDQRAFGAVLRYVCDPSPADENVALLFQHLDPERHGKVAYKSFVDSLDLQQTYAPSEAELREAFARLAAVFRGWSQSSMSSASGMKQLFSKYARSDPTHLTLAEFLKAMRSLGYNGPALDVELAFRHFAPGHGQGLSFDQFGWILKGVALDGRPASGSGLLERLRGETYGDNKFGTISFARLLNKQDVTKAGVVDLRGFKHVMKAVGSTMTDEEIKALFASCRPQGGSIVIRDFLERLRTSVNECTDQAQIRNILNILGTSVEFRNQGLSGWTSRFEMYDPNRDGKVDFYGYTKAVETIDCNKLSDYEKERLFNHYSGDRVTLDYDQLVCDVLYRPLNRGHEHRLDPFGTDPKRYVTEPLLLVDDVLKPPAAVLADRGIFSRLADALYAQESDGMGTLKLATYFKTASKAAKHLCKRDFIAAITGLVRPPSALPEYEVVALFEQLREGDAGVHMEGLLDALRHGHSVALSDSELRDTLARIQDQMWNCGKRTIASTREIFRSDVRDDGFIDLHDFTACMRRAGGGLYTDLELELLFNRFSPDRRLLEIEPFAAAIVPPTRLVRPECPGPSAADIQASIDRLGVHVFDPRRPTSGTLEFLKGIRQADRNRDDLLTRQEFMEALQYCGASNVLSANEMAAIFDAIATSSGVTAQASVKDLLRLVQESPAHVRVGVARYQELLATAKQYLPYVDGDITMVRVFERQDPGRTRHVALGPFTAAVLQLFNRDFPLSDLEVEHIFDMLDRRRTGSVNYMEFLDALASLPVRQRTKELPPRVVDVYRRTDVQPDMVRSPVSLRPPPPQEVPPDVSPFHLTGRVLPLDQPGMRHWHVTAGSRGVPYAGGAASLEEREARHARYRGLWVPGGPVHLERGVRPGTGCIPVDGEPASPRGAYIPGMLDNASDASVSTVLPPYLIEASGIDEWLSLLGLEKYLPLLRANEVDLMTLSELKEADLQDMGLPIGPRRKILKAARMMR